jgi:ADP-ribose pyrophosphatase YjhB (NUDIX family)
MKRESKRKKKPVLHEVSAGGVVLRRVYGRVHVALLQTKYVHRTAWVLPKGKVEKQLGETISDAAVREVKEELGIADVRLKRKLGTTKYMFSTPDHAISKIVHYYLMDGRSHELHPEKRRFSDAKWFPVSEALRCITHEGDREIILRAAKSPRKR